MVQKQVRPNVTVLRKRTMLNGCQVNVTSCLKESLWLHSRGWQDFRTSCGVHEYVHSDTLGGWHRRDQSGGGGTTRRTGYHEARPSTIWLWLWWKWWTQCNGEEWFQWQWLINVTKPKKILWHRLRNKYNLFLLLRTVESSNIRETILTNTVVFSFHNDDWRKLREKNGIFDENIIIMMLILTYYTLAALLCGTQVSQVHFNFYLLLFIQMKTLLRGRGISKEVTENC